MNERQIDLAHTVALGSIDDEDHQAVQELLDSEDPARRAEFITEVHLTREALGALAPPPGGEPPAGRGRGGGGPPPAPPGSPPAGRFLILPGRRPGFSCGIPRPALERPKDERTVHVRGDMNGPLDQPEGRGLPLSGCGRARDRRPRRPACRRSRFRW
ncbi:RskA family anti-sigma factor [Nocardia cyriacigeorgica]|uniref:RskA family anti-sigma factor n=1 Tax=Nocardia cyriacigeorgica TaxID=135487 RepID=UPI003CC7F7FC